MLIECTQLSVGTIVILYPKAQPMTHRDAQGDLMSDFRKEQLAAEALWKLRDYHHLFTPSSPRVMAGPASEYIRSAAVPCSYMYSSSLVPMPSDWAPHVQVCQ